MSGAGDHKGRPYGVMPEFNGLGLGSMGGASTTRLRRTRSVQFSARPIRHCVSCRPGTA